MPLTPLYLSGHRYRPDWERTPLGLRKRSTNLGTHGRNPGSSRRADGLAARAEQVGPAVPKVAFVASAQDYPASDGGSIRAEDVDFLARTKAMAEMHKTYAVTGGICVATAAMIEGTVVNDVCSAEAKRTGKVRIGHPSGVLEVFADVRKSPEKGWTLLQAGVCRTARPIMDGEVYVSRKAYQQLHYPPGKPGKGGPP